MNRLDDSPTDRHHYDDDENSLYSSLPEDRPDPHPGHPTLWPEDPQERRNPTEHERVLAMLCRHIPSMLVTTFEVAAVFAGEGEGESEGRAVDRLDDLVDRGYVERVEEEGVWGWRATKAGRAAQRGAR